MVDVVVIPVTVRFPRVLVLDRVVWPLTAREPPAAMFPVVLRVLSKANPLTVIEDVDMVVASKVVIEAFVIILEDACKRVVDREEMKAKLA